MHVVIDTTQRQWNITISRTKDVYILKCLTQFYLLSFSFMYELIIINKIVLELELCNWGKFAGAMITSMFKATSKHVFSLYANDFSEWSFWVIFVCFPFTGLQKIVSFSLMLRRFAGSYQAFIKGSW